MFQSYNKEVLCSVLFDQCEGDLDKAIKQILEMKKNKEDQLTSPSSENKDPLSTSSSLAEGEADGEKQSGDNPYVDQKSQELIDEMLAHDQQEQINSEQNNQDELVKEQMMIEDDLKKNRKRKTAGGEDLFDQFTSKLKESFTDF